MGGATHGAAGRERSLPYRQAAQLLCDAPQRRRYPCGRHGGLCCMGMSSRRCCGGLKIRGSRTSVSPCTRHFFELPSTPSPSRLPVRPSAIAQQSRWRPSRRRCASSAPAYDVCDKPPPPMAPRSACSRPQPSPVKKCRPSQLPLQLRPHRLRPPQMLPQKRLQTTCRNGEVWTLSRLRTRSRSAV